MGGFEEVLNNEYCSNLIQQDAFSLMELDDAVDCLSYFIHILSVVIGGDGKASAHYPLLDQYLSETLRFMELLQDQYEQYQGESEDAATTEPFNYERFRNAMTD